MNKGIIMTTIIHINCFSNQSSIVLTAERDLEKYMEETKVQ